MFSLAEGYSYGVPRTSSAITERALSPSCHLLPTPRETLTRANCQPGNTPGTCRCGSLAANCPQHYQRGSGIDLTNFLSADGIHLLLSYRPPNTEGDSSSGSSPGGSSFGKVRRRPLSLVYSRSRVFCLAYDQLPWYRRTPHRARLRGQMGSGVDRLG